MPVAESRRIVPVGESSTFRSTISHVTNELADEAPGELHLVYLAAWRDDDPHADRHRAAALNDLEQASVWAEADLEEAGATDVAVETAVLGTESYLFGPSDYVDQLTRYAAEHDVDTVVLDPEYAPVGNTAFLQPFEFELAESGLTVREAPVERPSRRVRVVNEITGKRFAAVFGVAFAFYMVLGDPTYWFDWVTGVASGLIVAITLSQVSLDRDPTATSLRRILRGVIYVPVLFWEILASNVVVARVILSPSLPIEPTMTRMHVLVGSGLPITTLANSITLTPGTLTVRARNANLYVHTLIPWAREGLFEGSLERWTRFIFYGRSAARTASPEERDDTAILQGEDADEPMPVDGDGEVVES